MWKIESQKSVKIYIFFQMYNLVVDFFCIKQKWAHAVVWSGPVKRYAY